LRVADVRTQGRATQGVRLINLSKKNDTIASVCKVLSATDEDEPVTPIDGEELQAEEPLEGDMANGNDAPLVDFEGGDDDANDEQDQ